MAGQISKKEKRVVKGPHGRLQVKRTREDGLTADRRRRFIDHLAATSNVSASAREIGIHVRSLFALRTRDPEFAAQWDEALDCAEARLIGKLHVYAETQGKAGSASAAGAGAEAGTDAGTDANDMAGFDPMLALQMLRLYRDRSSGRQRRRGGARPRVASASEVEEAVMLLLSKLDARDAREKKAKAAKTRALRELARAAASEAAGKAPGDGPSEERGS
jgi:hypothetical protein